MVQICENCGSSAGKFLIIIEDGQEHVFDCFECAIQQMAHQCAECDTRIIGHGIDFDGQYYCSYHCVSHDHDRAFLGADPDADFIFRGLHH